ncbi:MAG: primosomal protein N' [Pseudomonadota bacterium]
MSDMRFRPSDLVAVLTPLPVDRPYDYVVPPDITLAEGDLVEVEVGPNRMIGVVWGPGIGDADPAKVKPVATRLDLPPMPASMRAFLDAASDYTLTPLGAMLRLASRAPDLAKPPRPQTVYRLGPDRPDRLTPARTRVIEALDGTGGSAMTGAELAALAAVSSGVVKGLVSSGALLSETRASAPCFATLDPAAAPLDLSAEQVEAGNSLRASVAAQRFETLLLKGVTGSGKTEVYLEAVAECLAQGRQALILLPEIALTASFVERVEARFGARPAEWHSEVTGAARRRVWVGAATGDAQLVVGARSALFLPFADLGLVVVDEEHDSSYKQEDGALYSARDMAVLRASLCRASVILASATPSLETWANAEAGKYKRVDLPERFGTAELPVTHILDIRQDSPPKGRWIAPSLARGVAKRLVAGEQALLFLNRRGYAPLTVCRACGHFFECPDCDARLVEHRFRQRMMCHQCGRTEPMPKACPKCGRDDRLAASGPGIERLAEEAAALFPEARIAILSSDISSGSIKAHVAAIAEGQADLIIGTQIVAKGHNFPLLTLVGVIDADLGLQGGDLRAAERTFQLIRQVAGRAGRADRPGIAVVQTAAPEHPVMRALVSGDEEAFLREMAEERRRAGAPPYGRMAGIIISGRNEEQVWHTAKALGAAEGPIRAIGAELFGPAPAPISRIRGRVRARLLVKAPKGAPLQAALRTWRNTVKIPSAVKVAIDIDPQSFL